MSILEVGKPYHPSRRSWPEGAQYNYRGGEHELLLLFPDPSRHEVEAARRGEAEFALFVEGPLVVLCYRFGAGRGIPWSDAPYSFHLLKLAKPAEAVLPPPWEEGSPEVRALLHVILVSAEDGIVRALRVVSLSPEFTRAVHAAIWDQAHRPWDPAGYQRALDDLYRRYPTTDALVVACRARTKGGA